MRGILVRLAGYRGAAIYRAGTGTLFLVIKDDDSYFIAVKWATPRDIEHILLRDLESSKHLYQPVLSSDIKQVATELSELSKGRWVVFTLYTDLDAVDDAVRRWFPDARRWRNDFDLIQIAETLNIPGTPNSVGYIVERNKHLEIVILTIDRGVYVRRHNKNFIDEGKWIDPDLLLAYLGIYDG